MWDYRAQCVRVVDGDSFIALIDQGLGGRQEEELRLEGVSCPELHDVGGPECRDYTSRWINERQMTGRRWPLYVMTSPNTKPEPDERRSFVRYIAQVMDIQTRQSLNADLRAFLATHPEWGSGM